MRPATFTQDQIIAAGEALLQEGRSITGFALRGRVGGGNPTRLKQVWDEHVASQHEVVTEPVAELPVEVADEVKSVSAQLGAQLLRLAVELNDKAVKASERRVAEITRAAGEQTAQAERELSDAAIAVEELEEKLDTTNDELTRTREELLQSKNDGQNQAVELATLRERLAAAESRLEESDRLKSELKTRVSQLESDIDLLVTTHSEAISTLKEQHSREMAQARDNHVDEVKAINTRHAEIIEDLKVRAAAAERAVLVTKEQCQEDLEKLETQHREQITGLNEVTENAVRAEQIAREEKAALSGELLAMKDQVKNLSALISKAGQKKPAAKRSQPAVKK